MKGAIDVLRRIGAALHRFQGPALLVVGIGWDFLTLRVDRLADNVFLGLYLLAFAGAVTLVLRHHLGTGLPGWLERRPHWPRNLAHFLLGSLLSAYLIYYFRGAPLLRAGLWLVALGSAAVLNELSPHWLKNPTVWVPLLVLVGFHYALAAGPVLTGAFIGMGVPLLLATALAALVHASAAVPLPGRSVHEGRFFLVSSLGVGLALAVQIGAYRADLIPPLPLTLMATEVVPDEHPGYTARFGGQALAALGVAPEVLWTPGQRVTVKTAVYLPRRMSTQVLHVWERYLPERGWSRTDAIALSIRGGRRDGFRTYSRKRHLEPGHWRVRVTTRDGRELGRVRFDLVAAPVSTSG